MAAIGERGGPATATATATTVPDSDSDHECPEKEPEFVIDIVDDILSRPLLIPPRRQNHMTDQQLAHLLRTYPLPQLEYADMPKECTNCFICKIVHCILVLVFVGVTLLLATHLPDKYKEGDGALIVICPVIIAVLAVHWLMLDNYDKEQC